MIDYTYDNRNRLIREGEPYSEIEYSYDDRDNITCIYYHETNKTRIFTYDALDRLTSYDGKQVVYNTQNQLLYPHIIQTNDGHIELTWVHNKLVEYKKYVGNTVSEYLTFTYNHLGLRTQKINRKLNNKITNYVYDENNRLIYERTNNQIIKYYYDSNGLLVSFSLNGVMYFYDRDAFLNIKHIFDKNGNVVVSYKCNAYGQDEEITGPLASTIGVINPFRYKGYYYDVETQLYWVSSRYYSPELCRWISPDSIEYLAPESINGLNLYCYCNNDPVNKYDPSGCSVVSIIAMLIIVAGVLVFCRSDSYNLNFKYDNDYENDELQREKLGIESYVCKDGTVIYYIITMNSEVDKSSIKILNSYLYNEKQILELLEVVSKDKGAYLNYKLIVNEWKWHKFAFGIGFFRDKTSSVDAYFNSGDENHGILSWIINNVFI